MDRQKAERELQEAKCPICDQPLLPNLSEVHSGTFEEYCQGLITREEALKRLWTKHQKHQHSDHGEFERLALVRAYSWFIDWDILGQAIKKCLASSSRELRPAELQQITPRWDLIFRAASESAHEFSEAKWAEYLKEQEVILKNLLRKSDLQKNLQKKLKALKISSPKRYPNVEQHWLHLLLNTPLEEPASVLELWEANYLEIIKETHPLDKDIYSLARSYYAVKQLRFRPNKALVIGYRCARCGKHLHYGHPIPEGKDDIGQALVIMLPRVFVITYLGDETEKLPPRLQGHIIGIPSYFLDEAIPPVAHGFKKPAIFDKEGRIYFMVDRGFKGAFRDYLKACKDHFFEFRIDFKNQLIRMVEHRPR